MGSTKHEKSFVDFEKGYEQNIIGLKGIVYFGIGLFLLIVITFGLMWALLNVMTTRAEETAGPPNPVIMTDTERLPPEPRLQSAPGFRVQSPDGEVNLELTQPQSEYRTLQKIWADEVRNGQKDPHTGTVITLPVAEAKERYLQQQAGQTAAPGAEDIIGRSRMIISDSSAGRMATYHGK